MGAEPILKKGFVTNNIVTCGFCKGTGIAVHYEGINYTCDQCEGLGRLMRVVMGEVKLFTLDKESIKN